VIQQILVERQIKLQPVIGSPQRLADATRQEDGDGERSPEIPGDYIIE
jgi:hypothetical protein